MTYKRDLDLLGFASPPTLLELKARWRELASLHHPDRGGDAATFHQVSAAHDRVYNHLTKPRPCQPCKGTGKATVRGLKQRCPACGGKGRIVPVNQVGPGHHVAVTPAPLKEQQMAAAERTRYVVGIGLTFVVEASSGGEAAQLVEELVAELDHPQVAVVSRTSADVSIETVNGVN